MEALVEWIIDKCDMDDESPDVARIQIFCYFASFLLKVDYTEWLAGADGPYSPEINAILEKRTTKYRDAYDSRRKLHEFKNAINPAALWACKSEVNFDAQYHLLQAGTANYNPESYDLISTQPNIEIITQYRTRHSGAAASDVEIWTTLMHNKKDILELCRKADVHHEPY